VFIIKAFLNYTSYLTKIHLNRGSEKSLISQFSEKLGFIILEFPNVKTRISLDATYFTLINKRIRRWI